MGMASQPLLPQTPQASLFGLTALADGVAEYDSRTNGPSAASTPQSPGSGPILGLDTPTFGSPAPTASQLLDLPTGPTGTPFSPEPWSPPLRTATPPATSSPPGTAAAGASTGRVSPPNGPSPAMGRPAKAALAPLSSPAARPRTTSLRAMQALVNPPSPSAGRRLPPISSSGATKRTSGDGRKPRASAAGGGAAAAAAASLPSSPERPSAQRPSPSAMPSTLQLQAPVSTPQSQRQVSTPLATVADPRVFDGKDLHELVRVSTEDYNDVARLQRIITLALGGKTTEAAKAEALLQIREASVQNPLFSLTPAMVELVREALQSRNRLLRPAAAYALAGYAANSRAGRGLMAVNAMELLPRLNAMLRCRVDSMDARYASLAILTASMHSENKEAVGRSGSIPLLINLLRQNLGRHHIASFGVGENGLEHMLRIHEHGSVGQSTAGDEPTSSGETEGNVSTEAGEAVGRHHHDPHAPGGEAPPSAPHNGGGAAAASSQHADAHTGTPAHAGDGGATDAAAGGAVAAFRRKRWMNDASSLTTGVGAEPGGAGAGVGAGTGTGMLSHEGSQKGMYVLNVKPAGAHAAAALVNLAELPSNRQRMREAGITALLEDVLASRNENPIKERCRLLVDFLQMDTHRFKQAKAADDASAIVLAAHAAVVFHRHVNQALRAAGMGAAAAAGGAPGTAGGGAAAAGGALSGSMVGGSTAWKMARQLEKGEQEEEAPRTAGGGAAAAWGAAAAAAAAAGGGNAGKQVGREGAGQARPSAALGRMASHARPGVGGGGGFGGGSGGGGSPATTSVVTTVDAVA